MAGENGNGKKVEFSAKVDAEDFEEFDRNFPIYGARTWFITKALKEFNELVRQDPSVVSQLQRSIERMVEENRNFVLTADS